MQPIDFPLRGAYITLDALLKAVGVADSGGGAKHLIAEGCVQVDGREELRRGAKIRPGQLVAVRGVVIRLFAGSDSAL